MTIADSATFVRKIEAEHDLLVGFMHAMERTANHQSLNPIIGVFLHEMAMFHDGLLAELDRHADGASLSILTEDQRIIELRIQGLEIRYLRGEQLATDVNELIADWYRLHALRHAVLEQATADADLLVAQG